MATAAQMGEVDEMHSKEEDVTVNGEIDYKGDSEECEANGHELSNAEEPMDEDQNEESVDGSDLKDDEDSSVIESDSSDDNYDRNSEELDDMEITDIRQGDINPDIHEINSDDDVQEISDDKFEDAKENGVNNLDDSDDENVEDEENIEDDENVEENGNKSDSGEGDVVVIEKEKPEKTSMIYNEVTINKVMKVNDLEDGEIISLDAPIKKKKKLNIFSQPRRSTRNLNKQRSYVEAEAEEADCDDDDDDDSEESDIEEVLPQDPLAVGDPLQHEKSTKKHRMSGSTIVVKDTKRLVEIASKSTSNNSGKKEPTLVIIDTNSILSGRGPVPISQKPSISTSYPMLPMAVPAQGVYPPNMRATITPIPMTTPSLPPKSTPPPPPPTPILPTLTDDMFVVEAPSFIVPYVYEKPPLKDFKEFIKDMGKELIEQRKKEAEEERKRDLEEKEAEKKAIEDKNGEDGKEGNEKMETSEEECKELVKFTEGSKSKEDSDAADVEEAPEIKKPTTYFESPLGKFFMDIGFSLVQEFVQTDLLKQQKRKYDREGGTNIVTKKTIKSLLKNLESSKEHNKPYKMETKKCEFCSFKSESALAMAFHLETPHMKNYVYRCNFCTYEIRSPHDILFHMETQHGVRGRLERAPAFHQCPNCPFEDNQKGKLSRHLVACMRKFKPERNLDPPIDWEPPAKIPRIPRMKHHGLNATAAMYHAMAKSSQYSFISKLPQSPQMMHRGRGRPTLGTVKQSSPLIRTSTGMVYKQTMSGGSVLVPANYHLTGNQVYQVVGGQDMSGRLGPAGSMAFIPNISSASSTITIQQNSASKNKPVHQPSISITPLPRSSSSTTLTKPGDSNSKNSFVICEICDGYIKDLEQLRNHMQWIHKVKIHPKMIYNRPPLNCQKCQFRFFTDQGLERHLLGSHGLVTSSMQEAANRSKDSGRCPVCGRVYQWKLLNHVARDHNMTLKPAHLSYKCTVCTATFGMYKQFENHVYSAHSVVAKRVMDKKSTPQSLNKSDSLLKPLKINDEITIIPQPSKLTITPTASKEESSSTTSTSSPSSRNSLASISNSASSKSTSEPSSSSTLSRAERLARRKTSSQLDN